MTNCPGCFLSKGSLKTQRALTKMTYVAKLHTETSDTAIEAVLDKKEGKL